ncbi:MAG: hypothetical protein KDK70_41780 [Myxococcales bacterium]|nr:hypothetical protein [Myxococcales bacterium]
MNHIAKVALAAALVMPGCSEEGTTVDARGGTIVSDDGRFSLEIPPGALDEAVDITIDQVECEQAGAVGPCYEVGPVGMPLMLPATVTYELEEADLDHLDPEALVLLTEREEHWNPLPDRRVDMGDEVVTASAVYLSSYAVVIELD